MQGPGMTPELIARYDQRVPRYTSYPTAPHFRPDITAETYASWLGGTGARQAVVALSARPFLCGALPLLRLQHRRHAQLQGRGFLRGVPGTGDRPRCAKPARSYGRLPHSLGWGYPDHSLAGRPPADLMASRCSLRDSSRRGDCGRDRSADDHPGACEGACRLRPQPGKPRCPGFRPQGAGNHQAGAVLRADGAGRRLAAACRRDGSQPRSDVWPAVSECRRAWSAPWISP